MVLRMTSGLKVYRPCDVLFVYLLSGFVLWMLVSADGGLKVRTVEQIAMCLVEVG